MTAPKNVLVLAGSPRGKNSTSNSLGSYLIDRLDEKGIHTDTIQIYSAVRSDEGMSDLLSKVKAADMLLFSFPTYADSPTAGVISGMQAIAEERKITLSPTTRKTLEKIVWLLESGKIGPAIALISMVIKRLSIPGIVAGLLISAVQDSSGHKTLAGKIRAYLKSHEPKAQKLAVICNSGFLEPDRSGTAVDICRRFASETGIEWAGGMIFGGGPFIDGKPLENTGKMTRKLRQGLDMAAVDIAQKGQVSQEAIDLIAAPLMPGWLYILMASISWRIQAWKNGAIRKLGHRPFEL